MLRDLTLIVLVTSGAILLLTVSNARSTQKRIARTHIEQAATFAAQEFERRLAPVNQGLIMAWEWGKMGLVDATNAERVMEELTPVLRPLKKVTAVVIADSNGREVYLSAERDPDGQLVGWLTRTRGDPGSDGRYLQKSWSPDGKLLGQSWEDLPGYVPEERPWFVGAMANESDDASVVHVVAFDMLLSGIFQMVNEIQVSQHGVAFLCNSSGEVFLPSPAEPSSTRPTAFVPADDANNPLISGAVHTWLAMGAPSLAVAKDARSSSSRRCVGT